MDCVFAVLFVVTMEIDSKQNAKFSSVQVLQAGKEEGIRVEPWFLKHTPNLLLATKRDTYLMIKAFSFFKLGSVVAMLLQQIIFF